MKKTGKIIFSLLMAVSLTLSLAVPAFGEIKDTQEHWAEKQIGEFFSRGIISGYADGTFKPDYRITRAEFIAIANRAFGFTEKAGINFSDVPPRAWFAEDIAKAVAAGYITGSGNGAVKPNAPITKVEAAEILSILLKWDTSGNRQTSLQMKDAAYIPEWGKNAFYTAIENKYFQISPDGWGQPLKALTRAEAVTVLLKAIGGQVDVESIPDPAAVQEFKGVIEDRHCFVMKSPDKDTKDCLLMTDCADSGYGIAYRRENGWGLYPFDPDGQKLAKAILEKTTKDRNITVAVTGVVEGDIVKVLSISEDKAVAPNPAPEGIHLTKTMNISGMMCDGCIKHITEALSKIPGVKVERVSIGNAVITVTQEVCDETLTKAVIEAGYTVASID